MELGQVRTAKKGTLHVGFDGIGKRLNYTKRELSDSMESGHIRIAEKVKLHVGFVGNWEEKELSQFAKKREIACGFDGIGTRADCKMENL